jgi:hypothetical protein
LINKDIEISSYVYFYLIIICWLEKDWRKAIIPSIEDPAIIVFRSWR